MFLQTGGGGKGIRPNQQQQQQQSHHNQQQQQQSSTSSSASTHTQQQQAPQQQQQQQQHQSNHHQSHSHNSHHPGQGLNQHHQGSGSQASSASSTPLQHLGHPGQQQSRQHPAAQHQHLTYQQQQQQYSTYTQIHNATAAAALAQSAAQMVSTSNGAAQASANAACSTAVGSATTTLSVLAGVGSNGGLSSAGGSNGGGGGSTHSLGNYGRNHGGGGPGGAGNMAHFGANSAFLHQPPPGAGSNFMTQPPPGTYLPYHPHSQQSAVVLAAAAAAAAHFGNGGGGVGNVPSPGVTHSNASAVGQNGAAGGGNGANPLFATHPPPHSYTHPHRQPHPFYGHSTSVPPPQAASATHHIQHSQHQIRSVITAHQRHQGTPAFMMPTIFALQPSNMPPHPQNGSSQLMGQPTATPTHLPPPTYMQPPMSMMPTGLAPQPMLPPPSTLHTYAPPIAPMNSLPSSSGLYTKEHATKKRLHAIPIIDPDTNENILGTDTPRSSGSAQDEAADNNSKENDGDKAGSSSTADELPIKTSCSAVGVAVAVTVSPSLLSEARDSDKTITPSPSSVVENPVNVKTDQQMQTDAVARNVTDEQLADEDSASVATITAEGDNVELTNSNEAPSTVDTVAKTKNDGLPQTTDNTVVVEQLSDDNDDNSFVVPFPTTVRVDLSVSEEQGSAANDVLTTAATAACDSTPVQSVVRSKPIDMAKLQNAPEFRPAELPPKKADTPVTTSGAVDEPETYVPPSVMAGNNQPKPTSTFKEPLLQIPMYAMKQEARGGGIATQKSLPHYGVNNLNYQNQKTHFQQQPQQQQHQPYPPYQQHYAYHHQQQQQQQQQHYQQQQQQQQQQLHHLQYQLPHAQMQQMYHHSSTSSSASSLSAFGASLALMGNSATPTSSSNSSTSGFGAGSSVSSKSKKHRKSSRNTKDRDKKLKNQMEQERSSGGIHTVSSNDNRSPVTAAPTTANNNNMEPLSSAGNVHDKNGGDNNKNNPQTTTARGRSTTNGSTNNEQAGGGTKAAATVVKNATPALTTDLTHKNHPSVSNIITSTTNSKNISNSSKNNMNVADEKPSSADSKSAGTTSPKKSNRKDSNKLTKAQRSNDCQGKVDNNKKKQKQSEVSAPTVVCDDVKSCEDSSPANEETSTSSPKSIRTEDIVERFLQPAITSTLSNLPQSNGEDSQLQFLNSSSSTCEEEEEEELLQRQMQAREGNEVSTEGILFGDFGDDPLQAVAAQDGDSTKTESQEQAIFRPPSSTGGSTRTPTPEEEITPQATPLATPQVTPQATPQATPQSTPAGSPSKSRKSSIDSNASSRKGNRGRDHYHQNQKGGGGGGGGAKDKERERDRDRHQDKGKAKGKESQAKQVELLAKPTADEKTVAASSDTSVARTLHRYTLDVLKTLAKSKESLKPPMVMNCHKGDCISHLFVPRAHTAGNQQTLSTPAHQQQYQQMNFNESIDFMSKRRGGSGTAGSNMSKRQQNVAGSSGGGSGSGSSGGGAGAGSSSGGSMNAQAQRHMDYIRVHLSLKEEIKLSECANAWQPDALRSRSVTATIDGGAGVSSPNEDIEVVLKKVRGVLNKLTPDNFDVLLKSMTSIIMNTEEKMKQVMLLIFEKTVSEPNFAPTYAKFCKVLFQEVKSENKSLFSTLLIKRIQQEFETNVNNADAKRIKLQPLVDKLSASTDDKERVELKAELEDQEYQFRRRAWGTVRFIGEMYKLQSITSERVLSCIELLLEHGSEEKLEYMCKLLTTVGHQLEQTVADHANLHGRMDKIFKSIQQIVVRSQEPTGTSKKSKHQPTAKISSRVRFMMQDVIDLRSRYWDQPNMSSRPSTSSASAQRGRIATGRPDDRSRPSSSSSTTAASSSSATTRASGGGGGVGGSVSGYGGAASTPAITTVRRQTSDLRDHSGGRSGSGSSSYFLKKKEQQQQQQQQQQQHQQQQPIEQPKLNIDVNKLPFSRDEEQMKLGNQSMFMWRTAAGKQSPGTSASATTTERNRWAILGNMSAMSALHQQQQQQTQNHNNSRNNNAAVVGGASSGAGRLSAPNTTESNNNKAKGEATEAKLIEQELNDIALQQDDEVYYTMTTTECHKILNRLVEEFQDDCSHNSNATAADDTWKSTSMHIWTSLTAKQQISLLYNILMDYLHLATVKTPQRNALATIFSHLLRNGDKLTINRKKFNIAYKHVGEEFADLLVDVPNGWLYVFEFVGPMMHENALTFSDVWLTHWLDDCKFTERFLIAFITYFTREFGVNYVRELWSRERLERGQRFMKKEAGSGKRWDSFINSNHFQYIYERQCKSKHQQQQIMKLMQQKHHPQQRNTGEQLERIEYLIRTGGSECELAIDYVNSNVNVSEHFIRNLSTFLCCDFSSVSVDVATANNNNNAQTDNCSNKPRSSISSDGNDVLAAKNNNRQLDRQAFRQCSVLLRLCIDANETYEMACLCGIVDSVQQRYEPSTAGELICSAFSMLHESQVVSKKTFDKWYRAYRSNDSAGPGVGGHNQQQQQQQHHNDDYGAARAAMQSQAEQIIMHDLCAFMEKFLTM